MRRIQDVAASGLILCVAVVASTLAGGCAGRPSCFAVVGASGLTPEQVVAAGQGEGAIVTWGGVIAATRNLARETEIEAIAYRLDRCGKPAKSGPPIGRFIARQPGFLEPAEYRPGRRITATGRIAGTEDGRVGEASYRFPILDPTRMHLWPETSEAEGGGLTPRLKPYIGIGIGRGGFGGIGGGIGLGF